MKRSGVSGSRNFLYLGIVAAIVCAAVYFAFAALRRGSGLRATSFFGHTYPVANLPGIGFGGLDAPSETPPPLTIERMFASGDPAGDDPPGTVVLMATGDVIPARSVNMQALRRADFRWAFRQVSEVVQSADMTLINLETPLVSDCPPTDDGMIFCGDARHTEGLLEIGTDVASLANNHAGNYGPEGIRETVSHLADRGIAVTGRGEPALLTRSGTTYAFLAYNDIGARIDDMQVAADIRNAKQNADAVIVSFHWGTEYVRMPTTRQRHLAHLAIDSGAELVVGNHPHWYQPVEIYRDRVIVYAHGNFVFDQMWSKETTLGVIGRYGFAGGTLVSVRFIPIGIRDFGQAYFLEGNERDTVLSVMKQASLDLAGMPLTE